MKKDARFDTRAIYSAQHLHLAKPNSIPCVYPERFLTDLPTSGRENPAKPHLSSSGVGWEEKKKRLHLKNKIIQGPVLLLHILETFFISDGPWGIVSSLPFSLL